MPSLINKYNNTLGMGMIKDLRKCLVKFDFFPATQFLRYKGATEYKTATGGIFTILITVVFCLLFFSALIDIILKKNVALSIDIQQQTVPQAASMSFGPKGGFLFAISINGMNLSRTDVKYFDIEMRLNQFAPISQLVNSQLIPLQMCTPAHFKFNAELANIYTNFNGSNLLCPPLDYSLEIQGKVTSNIFKRFTISIKRCNETVNSNCATDQQVQQLQIQMGYFGLGVVLLNTQLNPSLSSSYEQYYLQQKNFFPFTTTLAIKANAEIQEYQIETDESILPFTETLREKGVRIPNLFQYNVIPVIDHTYALVHFEKSNTFSNYSRTFRKLDTLFAYVGGLIGTILGLIFILASYNQLCYELSLANKLYLYDEEEAISAEKFNFIYYLGYLLHKLFNRFICCKNIGKMQVFMECQQEIEKQLDIALLMKKLIYFERVITQFSTQLDINPSKYLEKSTIFEAKHFRQKYEEEEYQGKTQNHPHNMAQHSTEKNQDELYNKGKIKNTPHLTIQTQYYPMQKRNSYQGIEMINLNHQKISNQFNEQLLDSQRFCPYPPQPNFHPPDLPHNQMAAYYFNTSNPYPNEARGYATTHNF